jgi:integrase
MGGDGAMPRKLHRALSPRSVATTKKVGLIADGGGLYLQTTIGSDGKFNRSWIFRYTVRNRTRDMGLGGTDTFGLAEARDRARQARQLVADGVDPIERRKAQRAAPPATVTTFAAAAANYVKAKASDWKRESHRRHWELTVDKYMNPVIGKLDVAAVTTDHVMKILQPLWSTKPRTGIAVRGRLEAILDREKVLGHRTGDNPARWKGCLEHLLADPNILVELKRGDRGKHHPAMAYRDVPVFLTEVRGLSGSVPRALEFTVLCATRTGETIGARWDEIDPVTKVWTIGGGRRGRMKAGRELRVPLSDRCLAILEEMQATRRSEFIFPNEAGQLLHERMLAALLGRMRTDGCTVHGMRSAFRDWAAETTSFPREVCEAALAHSLGSTEAAYQRGDLLQKRAKLMQAWSDFCSGPVDDKVVILHG